MDDNHIDEAARSDRPLAQIAELHDRAGRSAAPEADDDPDDDPQRLLTDLLGILPDED